MYDKWATVDGTILEIKNMTDQHIKNCIIFIQKSMESLKDRHVTTFNAIDQYEELPEPNGAYNDRWYAMHGKTYIKAFEEELKKRS